MAKCWKFGDNISTDEIIPVQYMVVVDPRELGTHIMENVRPGFAGQFQTGDIIVAGENYGYGSSREHAVWALKGAGTSAVIARSYARIFYRNALNIGLPAIICPEAVDGIEEGDSVEVDLEKGTIHHLTKGVTYSFPLFPSFLREIMENGGLIETLNAMDLKKRID
ncbi:3-isopropylmalate dehydratase small subunit [Candidatus Formimonas warabiya]|uniref:3-isopropylmalate dehydratase small subunit n=1 Tax=Formimonas warabiya TaxID=1761012 RepID=A0A3G1KV95_FORW1|nr:3-isopropylmalate dehydratase small subunit [Candidatus Formimonas warabiya]ATW26125.1 3-isopropylmalate dehydratase small subunit [Candidatus Formimonas warabiya]